VINGGGEQPSGSQSSALTSPVLLFDGVCGLCNRFVQFVLRRDKDAVFRFASLQSPLAVRILARHAADASDLDTVCVVVNRNSEGQDSTVSSPAPELLLTRSDAVLFVLRSLGGIWRAAAAILRCIPRAFRDTAYRFVARHRYRIFGRYETCPLPDPAARGRFLDQPNGL